jgi:hypothetical protein
LDRSGVSGLSQALQQVIALGDLGDARQEAQVQALRPSRYEEDEQEASRLMAVGHRDARREAGENALRCFSPCRRAC